MNWRSLYRDYKEGEEEVSYDARHELMTGFDQLCELLIELDEELLQEKLLNTELKATVKSLSNDLARKSEQLQFFRKFEKYIDSGKIKDVFE